MNEIARVIDAPGLYPDIGEREYHNDCVGPAPSLSSSIAKLMFYRSPMHARFEHARLNPLKRDDGDAPTRPREIGTAAHKLILGAGRKLHVIDSTDYKNKAAQTERANAYAAGDAPILKPDVDKAHAIAEAAKRQMQGTECEGIFDDGDAELTMAWQDRGGVWCRGRIDFLPSSVRQGGHVLVPDLKTTGVSAHPIEWQRVMYDGNYDIQAVMYPRGLRTLIPAIRSAEMRFIVVEQDEPFGLSINYPSGEALEQARQALDMAISLWGWCLRNNTWPGYTKESSAIDPPAYHSMRHEMRRLSLLAMAAKWQAPLELDAPRAA